MYRVITRRFDQYGNWVVERGPWHPSKNDAENWATVLRHVGYNTDVESQYGGVLPITSGGSDDLREALANMA